MTVNHLYPHDYRADTLTSSSSKLSLAHITGEVVLHNCTGRTIRSAKSSLKVVGGSYDSLIAKTTLDLKYTTVTLTSEGSTINAEESHLNEVSAKVTAILVNTTAHTILVKNGGLTLVSDKPNEIVSATVRTDLKLTNVIIKDHAKSLAGAIYALNVTATLLEGVNNINLTNCKITILTLVVTEPNAKILSISSVIEELVVQNPNHYKIQFSGTLPRKTTYL